jgi:hypothetical protein
MVKHTKLGAAGASLLKRRTGAEALAAATASAPAAPKGRRTVEGYKVTTIRFADPQWAWLRRAALERSLESGTKADASEIVRELVAAAMTRDKKGPAR